MIENILHVRGAGITTDSYADLIQLAQSLAPGVAIPAPLHRIQPLDPSSISAYETLPQLAVQALHQAITMAPVTQDNENLGLILASEWGMIDSTAAYLESMLAADGRYASPRHFSRSVYSAATSLLAIHFHIHGPCLTLAFDEGEDPIQGALTQAHRLLAASRCDHVAVVWADQAGPIAEDLTGRAAKALHKPKYARYAKNGVGQGAVAVLLASSFYPGDLALIDLSLSQRPRGALPVKAFPMDAAVSLLQCFLLPVVM